MWPVIQDRSVRRAEHPRVAEAAPVLRMARSTPVSTLTLTLNSGNRYRIMVMVPGKRKFKLTLTVVINYSVLQLQPANLPWAGPKAPSTLGNGGRAVPELGYHVGESDRAHDLTLTETV